MKYITKDSWTASQYISNIKNKKICNDKSKDKAPRKTPHGKFNKKDTWISKGHKKGHPLSIWQILKEMDKWITI